MVQITAWTCGSSYLNWFLRRRESGRSRSASANQCLQASIVGLEAARGQSPLAPWYSATAPDSGTRHDRSVEAEGVDRVAAILG